MAVYIGNKMHYADDLKAWKMAQQEQASTMLYEAQKQYFTSYDGCEKVYAAERDRQVAQALACREAQLEKPDCDEKSIQADYERKVDKAQALYEKNREVVYKIYRSRIERATKHYNATIKALDAF